MDWSAITAAIVGAAIGLSGELTGRIGAKRQAERARQIAIEDAERSRAQTIEDERRREADSRARLAAENILDAFRTNVVHRERPVDDETRSRVTAIVVTMLFELVHLPNRDLRRRLVEMEHVLDAVGSGVEYEGYSLPEIVFQARVSCFTILGAWLRREAPLPASTEEWNRILQLTDETLERWEVGLADAGVQMRVLRLKDLDQVV